MRETKYQKDLVDKLEAMFPGCLIFRGDANRRQGVPDLLILHGECWAALEVKTSEHAPTRPNQPYYVDLMDDLSFASFIWPENEEQVLDELQQALTPRRASRVS
jgi:hypothetical protein